jgi:DNA sulfur modification protein DndB
MLRAKTSTSLPARPAPRGQARLRIRIGWQALATAARALIKHRPESWQKDLEKTIKAVNWQPGPHWNGIAMAGDRINNTGPGINATAGYILESGGFKKGQGV